MAKDTRKFLEILNRQNEAIAVREAKEIEENVDHIREQREQARREKYGTLRAREKPGNRPHRARSVFGHTDTS